MTNNKNLETNLEVVYEVVRIKQEIKKLPKKFSKFTDFIIRSPYDAAKIAQELIGDEDREVFLVLGLNTKNKVVAVHRCHVGSVNSSIAHPREIFKMAILNNCTSIICSHVHPSGNASPSPEDIEVTERLQRAGEIIGIEVIDHVIVTPTQDYVSLKEKGYI